MSSAMLGSGPPPSSDEEEDEERNYIPTGVIPSRNRGWQGERMEQIHQIENKKNNNNNAAAVDLKQFHNTQVGQGYQAKHVIRQRTGYDDHNENDSKKSTTKNVDMTMRGNNNNNNNDAHDHDITDRNKKKTKKRSRKSSKDDDTESRLQVFLQCDAMRKFRKELEDILSS